MYHAGPGIQPKSCWLKWVYIRFGVHYHPATWIWPGSLRPGAQTKDTPAMRQPVLPLIILLTLWLSLSVTAVAQTPADAKAKPTLAEILDNVEKRYALSGFTAGFFQSSTIKALNITDTAVGKISIKRPGKMRWIYEAPERQSIITDGTRLWIYRPDDNQVMIGGAPSYFGAGKGASFLTDIRVMKKTFEISVAKAIVPNRHKLKLVPREKTVDVTHIYVWISPRTWEVAEVATYNTYGDETRLEFSNIEFIDDLPDPLFLFTIPAGTDVVELGR
jgi:outer membrane lipoprotein carrier protein